jgi:hypothetical protein
MTRDEARELRDTRQRAENAKYGAPSNPATSWSVAEDAELTERYRQGLSLQAIARLHQRLEMDIFERVVVVGLHRNLLDERFTSRNLHLKTADPG